MRRHLQGSVTDFPCSCNVVPPMNSVLATAKQDCQTAQGCSVTTHKYVKRFYVEYAVP